MYSFGCPHCQFTSQNAPTYSQHLQTFHPGQSNHFIPSYICLCGKRAHSWGEINEHQRGCIDMLQSGLGLIPPPYGDGAFNLAGPLFDGYMYIPGMGNAFVAPIIGSRGNGFVHEVRGPRRNLPGPGAFVYGQGWNQIQQPMCMQNSRKRWRRRGNRFGPSPNQEYQLGVDQIEPSKHQIDIQNPEIINPKPTKSITDLEEQPKSPITTPPTQTHLSHPTEPLLNPIQTLHTDLQKLTHYSNKRANQMANRHHTEWMKLIVARNQGDWFKMWVVADRQRGEVGEEMEGWGRLLGELVGRWRGEGEGGEEGDMEGRVREGEKEEGVCGGGGLGGRRRWFE